jgi:hypothetical protein
MIGYRGSKIMSTTEQVDTLDLWRTRINSLINEVHEWAIALGWSTKSIEKTLDDAELGRHSVAALIMQKDTTRILLEPYARKTQDSDGSVDLYLMPAYDDLASLYHDQNGWRVHYLFSGTPPVSTLKDASPLPLTKEVFKAIVEEMVKNASDLV